ncbi:NUDIX hydrolase [Clostridium sp. 'deep sea']|uniref:NUDIX hydrolase n=1 Tax=Clostridium sp. 'deep sea' TaxID=2779445 RepID=UPI0018966500|nr:NUDIX hydrolase [Clostridium sp. 'deep sea']QOR36863.1 NUDIX hydrolase [Clostridium sp. 'deep sea']
MSDTYCLFNIRVTGVLIDKGKILLVQQYVDDNRKWSLPGGRVEKRESIQQALVREMFEETGLQIKCDKLLYICEKIDQEPALIHITFLVKKMSGEITLPSNAFDENPINDVKFFKFKDLARIGFTNKFIDILERDFPLKGSYMGDKKNIGL